uniref:Uncharacterized protein n=1 Tax=Anguilla anguilla TaxID=7936 RepID=A0A0E9XFJ8_ANGAN
MVSCKAGYKKSNLRHVDNLLNQQIHKVLKMMSYCYKCL